MWNMSWPVSATVVAASDTRAPSISSTAGCRRCTIRAPLCVTAAATAPRGASPPGATKMPHGSSRMVSPDVVEGSINDSGNCTESLAASTSSTSSSPEVMSAGGPVTVTARSTGSAAPMAVLDVACPVASKRVIAACTMAFEHMSPLP